MWVLLSALLAVVSGRAAALPALQAEHRLPPDLVLPDTASIPGQRLADWGVDKFFSLWYIFALSDNVQVSSECQGRGGRADGSGGDCYSSALVTETRLFWISDK